jgi:hypothetical protein
MIVVSLNVCGVGGAHKLLSLKRLVCMCKPDFITIWETMCAIGSSVGSVG